MSSVGKIAELVFGRPAVQLCCVSKAKRRARVRCCEYDKTLLLVVDVVDNQIQLNIILDQVPGKDTLASTVCRCSNYEKVAISSDLFLFVACIWNGATRYDRYYSYMTLKGIILF